MIIIGQVSGKEKLEAHFEASLEEMFECEAHFYVGPKQSAMVITSQNSRKFISIKYGMIPFWSTQEILHYESPVEGSVNSQSDSLKKRIIQHPSCRRPIRETRCLIPVDYFIIENQQKQPYLFFCPGSRPFALAGIYDNWKARSIDSELYQGFSILTTPSGEISARIGITRFPVIIPLKSYKRWLNPDAHLMDITKLLNPVSDKQVNGYPINRTLFEQKLNSKELVKPNGDLLYVDQSHDYGKLAGYLKSFRYKRGLTHSKNDQEQRIWRDQK